MIQESSNSSKTNWRGPLVAVIRIQLAPQNIDKIYLHQRDDHKELALKFIQKHKLPHVLLPHIIQQIQNTRQYANKFYPEQQSVSDDSMTSELQQRQNKTIQKIKKKLFKRQQDEYIKEQRQKSHEIQQYFGNWRKQSRKNIQQLTVAKKKNNEKQQNILLQAPTKQIQKLEQSLQEDVKLFNFNTKQSSKLQKNNYGSRSNTSLISKINNKQNNLKRNQSLQSLKKNDYNSMISNRDKPLQVKILNKQQMQSLKQSNKKQHSKQQISKINQNVTRRLYNQTSMKQHYLKLLKQKAQLQAQKEKKQKKQLTLKPEINKISKSLAEDRKKPSTSIQNYLLQIGKQHESRKTQKISRKHLQQIQQCTFRPQINLISKKLATDRHPIQIKQVNYDQPLFKPTLNPVTKQIMKNKGKFEDRLQQYLQHKNVRLAQKIRQKQLKQKYDIISGQEMFHPKIKDIGARQQQGKNIWNYLHQKGKQVVQSDKSQAKPQINQISQKLVQSMQFRRITWLFGQLDSDQDGVISAQKISISSIPHEILRVIKPVLFQMQQMQIQLNLSQFKCAIDQLHKGLNANQKSILYNYRKPVLNN